jgi:hypothetical protein
MVLEYVPHGTYGVYVYVRTVPWYHGTYYVLILLCHDLHVCVRTYVRTYVSWYIPVHVRIMVPWPVPWYRQLHPVHPETGGRVNKAARDWLDALTAPEPGEQVPSQDDHPWDPQTRTTTETVLRVLARIVVEIRAADIAVELEP